MLPGARSRWVALREYSRADSSGLFPGRFSPLGERGKASSKQVFSNLPDRFCTIDNIGDNRETCGTAGCFDSGRGGRKVMATFIFTASRNPIMDSQEASIRVTDCVIVSMMLLWITDGSASGAIHEFQANCRKLGDTAEIVVIYKDIVATEDSSRTVKSLKSLSSKAHDLHHHVYG